MQNQAAADGSSGVNGHFTSIDGSPLPPWVSVEQSVNEPMAKIVGAKPDEIAVMGTLTANLHLLMGSFYRPTAERYKIMVEGKAFPSDRYLVESQIRAHNLDPEYALIVVEPGDPDRHTLTTEEILDAIQQHGESVAVLLFPAVSYFTGQVFDMRMITKFAHAKGIMVGFDLAHAAGNIKMELHEWQVDFAAWCCYKYLNSGPGGIASIFVHEKHTTVDPTKGSAGYRPRLAGWWGHDLKTRFAMGAEFVPIPGAAGFQVSNPSVLDMTALKASLDVFSKTNMTALVTKSRKLTNYLLNLLDFLLRCYRVPTPPDVVSFIKYRLDREFEHLDASSCSYIEDWQRELMARHCLALIQGDVTITEVCRYPHAQGAWNRKLMALLTPAYEEAVTRGSLRPNTGTEQNGSAAAKKPPFSIITPLAENEHGNMISIKVRSDLLEHMLHHLEDYKCMIDVRKPDVIRIAPTPLYNTFNDLWQLYKSLDHGIWCSLDKLHNSKTGSKDHGC